MEILSDGKQLSLKEIFKSRKVCILNKEDKISWCAAASSKYSIKLGYEILDYRTDECFDAGDLC